METKPNRITKEHILQAMRNMDERNQVRTSTIYDVIYDNKTYSPKDVMREANLLANGIDQWDYNGGWYTNKWLAKLGFEVVNRHANKHAESRHFFKYSPGSNAENWEKDLEVGEMAISFIEHDVDLNMISTHEQLNELLNFPKNDKSNISWNLFLFKNAKIGDVILANRGLNTLLGIGIITGSYEYNADKTRFKHSRKVEWIINHPWGYSGDSRIGTKNLFRPDTFAPTKPYKEIIGLFREAYPEYDEILEQHDLLFDFQHSKSLSNVLANMHNYSKNQILYGPPGTGKTYHTINKALAIIENKTEEELGKEGRLQLKKRYQNYVDSGQIVFTTFHQSMSYEDFIEGIKPKTVNEKVVYEVEPGIFKNICDRARLTKGNFDAVLESLKVHAVQGGEPTLVIKSKATSFDVEYRGTNVFYVQPHNSSKDNAWYPVNIENIRKVFETGNYDGIYNPTYVREIIAFMEKEYNLKRDTGSHSDNYVLIIDEINRGNVSAIFGELITLIEESKRAGSDEALEVVLPYSKQRFSVPGNLYIIGTMNTADRSVEALDTALRRRFSFQQMLPQPELIRTQSALRDTDGKLVIGDYPEIDLAEVLSLINKRISALLDADHQIGHSYFMQVKTREDLANAFKNCIMPLLQEYFYHDEEKIAWVLGEGFIGVKPDSSAEEIFPDLSFGHRPNAVRNQYCLKEVNGKDIGEAINLLIGRYA